VDIRGYAYYTSIYSLSNMLTSSSGMRDIRMKFADMKHKGKIAEAIDYLTAQVIYHTQFSLLICKR